MRRFLDGYYPMHVSMDISFGGTGLQFIGIRPPEQQGFTVREDVDAVHLDTWFEGRLKTELQFAPK
jgi:hypothetical protein